MNAIISAVGHYVPETRLTNADLEKLVDTSDEWIMSRTGIKERRILDTKKGTSHMAVKAAEMVLAQRGISPEEIDVLLTATVTPDLLVPSMAAVVQRELGATRCWGYDLNGGCTGFLCAFTTAAQFIESGRYRKVLVIGADKMSAIIDYEDRNTCILFGDGAGAVLVEPSDDDDTGVKDFILHMDGSGEDYLYMTGGGSRHPASLSTVNDKMHYLYQDGRTVYKHAVNGMADVFLRVLERNGLSGEDVNLFIPHQANYRIIDAVAKKVGISKDRVMINVHKYGNTTAGTIPIALSEAHQENRMKYEDWVVMAAFGAGFTWGSVLLKWALK
ncbi:3-oxoacyl-[acyl-carrier-protein] synthase, KASIII (EC [Olavius algarvensis associated proteobacterium Delta 3]|nr:3-oxoacyl-[acyl-carrier-protein] synthase, KASIII (EC [Olavius algarvensis associated proteobacterium Delta 3]CAB5156325.1 3-oxoacyl-[acyl-carrier-protein] synthase, KASIII (EC [Olavius algarvensis associated proteobacterium Delta 3]